MKLPIYSVLTLFVALSVSNLAAQDYKTEAEMNKKRVAEDVTQAFKKANVQGSALLLNAFADTASGQTATVAKVYATVPRDQRVTRLAHYLAAKAKASPAFINLTYSDFSDFNWAYIVHDIGYLPLRLESSGPAKLLALESIGGRYEFSAQGTSIIPGAVILFPAAPGQELAIVSATFELANQKALWTGSLSVGILKIASTMTTRGCEIYVNSTPPKAAVFFNGKEWYRRTNTSAVHDPGSWEVTVRLKKYKDWRERRALQAGESWTINAVLDTQ